MTYTIGKLKDIYVSVVDVLVAEMYTRIIFSFYSILCSGLFKQLSCQKMCILMCPAVFGKVLSVWVV